MNTKRIFDELGRDLEKYKSSIRRTLETYKKDNEAAKNEAAKYKNESEEYSRRYSGIVSAVRSEVGKADEELAEKVKTYYIPELKKAIAAHVTEKPDNSFLDALGIYQRFGLKPSRFELEALLTASEGNYMGLRCLKSLANAGGYDLTFSSIEDYEKDLEALEKLTHTPIMWCGNDYETARVTFPDVPLRRKDGSVYGSGGRPSAIYLVGSNLTVDRIVDHLGEMSDKWATTIVPQITEFKPVKNEDGQEVTPEEQRAEAIHAATEQVEVSKDQTDLARQLGVEKAEAEAQTAAVVEYYVKGGH